MSESVPRVLIVYYRALHQQWLPTYMHSLRAFEAYSNHECIYLNAARGSVPQFVVGSEPDLVIFHYTLLLRRQWPDEFRDLLARVDFTRGMRCPKAFIAQDEQVRMDLLNTFVGDFGITHIFSPAPPSTWPTVYREVDRSKVSFHSILNGYMDEGTLRRVAGRARRHHSRPVDIGYRSWHMQPFYGRHGQLKQVIGQVVSERAPVYGLVTDISGEYKDALWGDRWFDFLLDCKYTIGVEGGCSVFDWDGSVAARTLEYVSGHPDASFDEIEAACFPGLDGKFEFYTLSPRHLEAIMTRTCQILVEGTYGGILQPGLHYIELKRDLSNVDEVLQLVKDDQLREGIVERAYRDVVESGAYTFEVFANQVLGESLKGVVPTPRRRGVSVSLALATHRVGDWLWDTLGLGYRGVRRVLRSLASSVMGEQRLGKLLSSVRGPRN